MPWYSPWTDPATARVERTASGSPMGVSAPFGANDDHASSMRFEGHAGGWDDPRSGRNYGLQLHGTAGGFQNDPAANRRSGFWGGITAGEAWAEAYHNDSVTTIGAEANILDGSVGYRTVDAKSDHDRGMRVGAGIGAPGGALRIHHSDADHDGRREYGLGLDVPVPGTDFGVGFDYTSENLGGDLASAALAGPFALPMLGLNAGMDAVGLGDYAPGNLLSRAGHTIAGWLGR